MLRLAGRCPGTPSSTASTRTSASTNGTATMCSSATATGCSAPTSSTAAATRRWGPPGATSTLRRSAVRRLGRSRQRGTPRTRRTSGGTGTTTTRPRPRLTRSGSRCRTLEKPPSEKGTQGRKRAKGGLWEGSHFAAPEQPEASPCDRRSRKEVLRPGAKVTTAPSRSGMNCDGRNLDLGTSRKVRDFDRRAGRRCILEIGGVNIVHLCEIRKIGQKDGCRHDAIHGQPVCRQHGLEILQDPPRLVFDGGIGQQLFGFWIDRNLSREIDGLARLDRLGIGTDRLWRIRRGDHLLPDVLCPHVAKREAHQHRDEGEEK